MMVLGNSVAFLTVGLPVYTLHILLTITVGHAGHDTVDYVLTALPNIIKTALISAFKKSYAGTLSPDAVSDILDHSIQSLDHALTTDLLRLFPNSPYIDQLSDEEISATVNDIESGGVNSNIVARCMRGSTILVSLVDPSGSNLWVASLGDSIAGDFPALLDEMQIFTLLQFLEFNIPTATGQPLG